MSQKNEPGQDKGYFDKVSPEIVNSKEGKVTENCEGNNININVNTNFNNPTE